MGLCVCVCVCVQAVSFVTSSGQVHEPWENYGEDLGVTVKFLGTKVTCTKFDLILRVIDCTVTISFGVCLVLWLF